MTWRRAAESRTAVEGTLVTGGILAPMKHREERQTAFHETHPVIWKRRARPVHRNFKINAILVLLLSTLFYLFFDACKHNPALSSVNPFADDPYDAIGSFGIQAAAVLTLLSVLRAFWPHSAGDASGNREAVLVRTQMMAILAVGITMAGNIVAMLRHRSMWIATVAGHLLALLVGGMVILTAATGWLVDRTKRGIDLPRVTNVWKRAIAISCAAAVFLAFYPEYWRLNMVGGLLTALLGTGLLFLPLWALGTALVPYRAIASNDDPVTAAWQYLGKRQSSFVFLGGALIGLLLAFAELHDPNGWPHLTLRIASIASAYICLETLGVLIGYCLLRKPLGLCRQNSLH